MSIRRRFVDIAARQIHCRMRDADGPTLVVLHASPGSSAQCVPLLQAITDRRVLAPDLAGLGDSDPHPCAAPQIADFADDTAAVIEIAANGQVDLYGSHTGACVAIELAARRPDLIRRVILDGVPLWSAAERRELAARYAPPKVPDAHGAHLLWAHHYCRDQLLFWPWFDTSATASRNMGLPSPDDLHRLVIEVIKSIRTYHLGYHAVFDFDVAARLPAVSQPTLCLATTADPLGEMTAQIVDRLPNGEVERIGENNSLPAPALIADAISRFLSGAHRTSKV